MQIQLQAIKKKYVHEWIIKDLNHTFFPNTSTAIIGHNGSGKSTLLKLIAGITPPTKGKISFFDNNILISEEEIFQHITFAAPYQQLIEEYTLVEFLEFHRKFKDMDHQRSNENIASMMELEDALHKQIYHFSSGMKQRLKLGVALLSAAKITLLDEPLTNLDKSGVELYYKLISDVQHKRLILIASNDEKEYEFCDKILKLAAK